jgi:L-2-hydroxyglutarate oxidase LhgO
MPKIRELMVENVEVEHVIVGAGVIGLAIGAALARKGREAFVLERGARIGCGISSRNSEVVHSGVYYETNSLKRCLCVEGRRLLYAYCAERGIAHRKCGKLVVATNEGEVAQVVALARRAQENGVENVELLDAGAVKRLEPALNAVAALHLRETGIVDANGLMQALACEIEEAGGAVLTWHDVVGGRRTSRDRFELEVATVSGELTIATRTLILAAGPWTHSVEARIDGLEQEHLPPLFLAKGSYFSLSGASPFDRLIYPAPVSGGLGVHVTLDLAGSARFGPDVERLASNDPDAVDFSVDPSRAEAFYAAIRRYWPELKEGALQPAYAGVRPKLCGPGAPNADFAIQGPRERGAGLVVLYGIESPGLTCALAIGEHVGDMLTSRE